MAILCSPVSANDLQAAEKDNSVFIIRKLDYSERNTGYLSRQSFFDYYDEFPFKLMFVFGKQDAIIVRNASDKQIVENKLASIF
jgi:hypothetical protein